MQAWTISCSSTPAAKIGEYPIMRFGKQRLFSPGKPHRYNLAPDDDIFAVRHSTLLRSLEDNMVSEAGGRRLTGKAATTPPPLGSPSHSRAISTPLPLCIRNREPNGTGINIAAAQLRRFEVNKDRVRNGGSQAGLDNKDRKNQCRRHMSMRVVARHNGSVFGIRSNLSSCGVVKVDAHGKIQSSAPEIPGPSVPLVFQKLSNHRSTLSFPGEQFNRR